MAIIYTYPRLINLDNTDLLLISDSTSKRKPTMSVKLGDLAAHIIVSQSAITGSGRAGTIPFFDGNTTIASSPATYSTTGGGQTGAQPLFDFPACDISSGRGLFLDIFCNNISASQLGTVTVGDLEAVGNTIIGDTNADTLTVNTGGVLINGLGNYANDAAAAAGGVLINGLYRNGNNVQIRSSASGGYNSYVALLSTGFTPPAATVLSNNLTATLTWARVSQGTYTLTASAATFTNAKTIVFINPGSNIGTTITWTRTSDTVLTISTYTSTGQLDDGIIGDGSFEVRIYS